MFFCNLQLHLQTLYPFPGTGVIQTGIRCCFNPFAISFSFLLYIPDKLMGSYAKDKRRNLAGGSFLSCPVPSASSVYVLRLIGNENVDLRSASAIEEAGRRGETPPPIVHLVMTISGRTGRAVHRIGHQVRAEGGTRKRSASDEPIKSPRYFRRGTVSTRSSRDTRSVPLQGDRDTDTFPQVYASNNVRR